VHVLSPLCRLAGRYEDLTHPSITHANPKADRTVAMYGYVRGTFLKQANKVHVLGEPICRMSAVCSRAMTEPLVSPVR